MDILETSLSIESNFLSDKYLPVGAALTTV